MSDRASDKHGVESEIGSGAVPSPHRLPALTLVVLAALVLSRCSLPAPVRAGERTEPLPRLERSPCVTQALRELGATCHTFFGPEDHDEPDGKIVTLPVAVIEPAGKQRQPGAVFFFPGGPGYSILENPAYLARLRRDVGPRTLVVMDHRGFVHAEPSLRCPDYAAVSPYHNRIHAPALTSSPDPLERLSTVTPVVARCYRKLAEQGIEVAQYNSYAVCRDVDAIRDLLGYEQIDVFGSSTGAGTALLYLRYFPDRARSAVFGWPWYAHLRNRSFLDEFHTARQTFTDVLARCVAESPACRRLLPAWLREIDRTRRRLDQRPYVTTVEHGEGGETKLRFDGAAFLDTLYLTLADDYARLPAVVAAVRAGDHGMLRDFFRVERYDPSPEAPRYALGYFLAHVCNDMGANRPEPEDSLAAVRREPAILGFEPPWVCAWWGGDGDVPPEHNDPVASSTPALAIHGQLDPCCGRRWSDRLAETMSNLQIVELQGVGHSPTTECRSKLIQSFLDEPRAAVDRSCANEVPLGPWKLDPEQPSP